MPLLALSILLLGASNSIFETLEKFVIDDHYQTSVSAQIL